MSKLSVKLFPLFALALAVGSAASVQANEIPETYLGAYLFAGGQSQRRALTREIDRVADQLSFFIRGIARGRMHDGIRPKERIAVQRANGAVTLQFDDSPHVVCDGSWQPGGADDFERRCAYIQGRLRYSERHDDASRVNQALALSGDGRTLWVTARISNPRLPDDIRYRLSYRRR